MASLGGTYLHLTTHSTDEAQLKAKGFDPTTTTTTVTRTTTTITKPPPRAEIKCQCSNTH